MKKIIRLTESDLARIIKRVIKESEDDNIWDKWNTIVEKNYPNLKASENSGYDFTAESGTGTGYIKLSTPMNGNDKINFKCSLPVAKWANGTPVFKEGSTEYNDTYYMLKQDCKDSIARYKERPVWKLKNKIKVINKNKKIMKRIIRLTESDLARIVRRVIREQEEVVNNDFGPIEMGSVDLTDPVKRGVVTQGFYKYSTSQASDGSKLIYGKTYWDNYSKNYKLICNCKDKTTKLVTTGNPVPVKVLSPNWERFC